MVMCNRWRLAAAHGRPVVEADRRVTTQIPPRMRRSLYICINDTSVINPAANVSRVSIIPCLRIELIAALNMWLLIGSIQRALTGGRRFLEYIISRFAYLT
jgi:hypothetical protein